MAYELPDLVTDEDAVTDEVLDGMADRLEGWEAVEGAPEVALGEEFGRETALLRADLVEVLGAATAAWGQSVFGLPVDAGDRAELAVTITVSDAAVEVPAGLTVLGTTTAGLEVAFELPEAIAPPGTSFPATMRAVNVGAAANGVPAGDLVIVTATATVETIVATGASVGGVDAETQATYLDRLVAFLSSLKPGGVTGDDMAALARTVAGVERALGADLYDSVLDDEGVDRTVSVAALDAAGVSVVGTDVGDEVLAVLEAAREINLVIQLADPNTTNVTVVAAGIAEVGFDPDDVEVNMAAAAAAFLSPTSWGTTAGDSTSWVETGTVHYLDVVRAVGAAAGLASITALTINGGTIDVDLADRFALPVFIDGGFTCV